MSEHGKFKGSRNDVKAPIGRPNKASPPIGTFNTSSAIHKTRVQATPSRPSTCVSSGMSSSSRSLASQQKPVTLKPTSEASPRQASSVFDYMMEDVMGDETNNEAEDEEDGGIPTEAQYTTPQYRSTGRDPMLLHIWTGLMNDSRKIYRPVYRRNRHGTLQRWSYWGRGAWGYSDVPRFDPAHVDGKTDAAEERKEVREPVPSQESVDKGKRRTLADFEFPETEEKGGWRLL